MNYFWIMFVICLLLFVIFLVVRSKEVLEKKEIKDVKISSKIPKKNRVPRNFRVIIGAGEVQKYPKVFEQIGEYWVFRIKRNNIEHTYTVDINSEYVISLEVKVNNTIDIRVKQTNFPLSLQVEDFYKNAEILTESEIFNSIYYVIYGVEE